MRASLTARRSGLWLAAATASIAATAVLATACGTGPGRHGNPPRVALARTHAVQPADSRARATAYARELLASLVLPAGARKLSWPARVPAGLLPARPAVLSDFVDLKALYQVRQSMSATYDFLLARQSAGTTADAYGQGTLSGAVTSQFADFSRAHTPDGIFSADLNTVIEPRPGGGSLLRADAFVAWYPPRGTARRIVATAYRAVTVRWLHGYSVTARTFTSRHAVLYYAGLYNGLHGAPDVETSCPNAGAGMGRNDYQIAFIPAGDQPRVVINPTNCMFVDVSIGGRQVSALYPAAALLSAARQAVRRSQAVH
ncbi:MAG TPA: hypothetical protein VMA72_30085 [Streptosporangiaceae bacterium]|nr:hypothetical protein [Streptosporangiaceae bacterium]